LASGLSYILHHGRKGRGEPDAKTSVKEETLIAASVLAQTDGQSTEEEQAIGSAKSISHIKASGGNNQKSH
jgi:hypothetical protein